MVARPPMDRRQESFCGGSCRPLPPLSGGGLSRPALPRAPSWAVFFMVSRGRRSRPKSAIFVRGLRPRMLKNHK